jgi:hypothetical protein
MELVSANKYQDVDFVATSDSFATLSIDNYLELLVNRVYQYNSLILIDKIYTSDDGLSCLNVIIPGTEEFFHIFNEHIIIPQEHTKAYLKHRLNFSSDPL